MAEGTRPWHFFYDAWNVFDFVVVFICFMRIEAAVLRMLRLLRSALQPHSHSRWSPTAIGHVFCSGGYACLVGLANVA